MDRRDRSESRRGRLRSITPAPSALPWAEEVALLEQVGDPLASILWRQLRIVQIWASTPAEERADLFQSRPTADENRFAAACIIGAGLQEPFATFARLRTAPGEVTAEDLAGACLQVSEWADRILAVETALVFAEAASRVDDSDPWAANTAGKLAKRASKDDRSATWYHRAYGLAVRRSDHTAAIRGMLGYGGLMKQLGKYPEARRYFEKAAARAVRTGRRREGALAHHDLLALCAEEGNLAQALRHVRSALDLYPQADVHLPALAHDWGFLLLRLRLYSPALRMFDLVLPLLEPNVEVLVQGSRARALAGSRKKDAFDTAVARVLELASHSSENAAGALMHVAEGSVSFAEWDRARVFATQALTIARVRKDARIEEDATALLERVAVRRLPEPEVYPDTPRLFEVAGRFEERLTALHRGKTLAERPLTIPGAANPLLRSA